MVRVGYSDSRNRLEDDVMDSAGKNRRSLEDFKKGRLMQDWKPWVVLLAEACMSAVIKPH